MSIRKSRIMREDAAPYLATTTQSSYPIMIDPSRGDGVYLWDEDGNRYIDFCSGAGVSNLGHGHQTVMNAVARQLFTGFWQYDSNVYPNTLMAEVARRLCELTPGAFSKKVFFSNSGAEANEAALKLVFDPKRTVSETALDILISAQPHKTHIVCFENAFHGRTGYVIPLLGGKEVQKRFFPVAYPVHRFPFPAYEGNCKILFSSLQEFKKNWMSFFERSLEPVRGEVAAVVIELVQGEGGIIPADPDVVQELYLFCKKQDIPFVVDEVQTGCGRTGTLFVSEQFGVEPDVMTLAKALTSGAAPCGATVFRHTLDFSEKGRHSNTYGGQALAMSAALATLAELTRPGFLQSVREKGEFLKENLQELFGEFNTRSPRIEISPVRGSGLMLGVDFKDGKTGEGTADFRARVVQHSLSNGLILLEAGNPRYNPTIRFMPPLTISYSEMRDALSVFREALFTTLRYARE